MMRILLALKAGTAVRFTASMIGRINPLTYVGGLSAPGVPSATPEELFPQLFTDIGVEVPPDLLSAFVDS
jgi:hypothetical protein